MKGQTLAETVVDVVIGLESSDVLVPRGNMLKIGFSQGFSQGMVMSCSEPWLNDSLIVKKILVFADTG